MKKSHFALAIGTAFIVGAGSFALVLSMRQVKNNIQTELSSNETIQSSQVYETEIIEKNPSEQVLSSATKDLDIVLFPTYDYSIKEIVAQSPIYQEKQEEITQKISEIETKLKSLQKEEKQNRIEEEKRLEAIIELREQQMKLKEELSLSNLYDFNIGKFMYQGKQVAIEDALLEKEVTLENGKKVMDFVYDYVDKTIFEPYEIDKTQYNYSIRRQYHMAEGINYAVFLHGKTDSEILATIGILLEEEPMLQSFARDGLIELAYGPEEIPNTYWVNNWCETTEQREKIYAQYLEESKKIITMLGLPSITEEIKNLDSVSYFDADNGYSTVTFGYVLEDGRYVKLFYNRINGKWDGFSIAGYHKEYENIMKNTEILTNDK